MEREISADYRQSFRQSQGECSYRDDLSSYIAETPLQGFSQLEHFPKYVTRQSLARYLALYEIFKLIKNVHGDIVQCGVNWGGSLMAFAQYSAILEPVNLQRRVVGFDTFAGFSTLDEKDQAASTEHSERRLGGYRADAENDIQRAVGLFDRNRFLGHVEKVTLVVGDACVTIPDFVKKNAHQVVSLLHLDFDVYAPTKIAIEQFLPLMPKGAVIIFDELGHSAWPGETQAVRETLGLHNLCIQRFEFEPFISYAIVE